MRLRVALEGHQIELWLPVYWLQVMCATYEPPRDPPDGKHVDMKPLPTNTRHACAVAMEKAASEEPWFGIEQVRALCGVLVFRGAGQCSACRRTCKLWPASWSRCLLAGVCDSCELAIDYTHWRICILTLTLELLFLVFQISCYWLLYGLHAPAALPRLCHIFQL